MLVPGRGQQPGHHINTPDRESTPNADRRNLGSVQNSEVCENLGVLGPDVISESLPIHKAIASAKVKRLVLT